MLIGLINKLLGSTKYKVTTNDDRSPKKGRSHRAALKRRNFLFGGSQVGLFPVRCAPPQEEASGDNKMSIYTNRRRRQTHQTVGTDAVTRSEFLLSSEELKAWEALNERPPRDLPGLRKLMQRRSPFIME